MALKNKEIAKLSPADTAARILDIDKELLKLNAQRSSGAAQKNNRQIRVLRHTKAKLLGHASRGGKAKR